MAVEEANPLGFHPRADSFGKTTEARTRWLESIAVGEPAVIYKTVLDSLVTKDHQRNGCLAPSNTYEGDRFEVFSETNNLFDQFATSKIGPLWRRWEFQVVCWMQT